MAYCFTCSSKINHSEASANMVMMMMLMRHSLESCKNTTSLCHERKHDQKKTAKVLQIKTCRTKTAKAKNIMKVIPPVVCHTNAVWHSSFLSITYSLPFFGADHHWRAVRSNF